MIKQCLLLLTILSLCVVSNTAQSHRKSQNQKSNQPNVLRGKPVRIPLELIEQMARDDEGVKDCANSHGVEKIAEYLTAEMIELHVDKRHELLVSSTSSGPDNCLLCSLRRCNYWIYNHTNYGYTLLLAAYGPDYISPLKTFTNGYRDLQIVYPPQADLSVYVETLKFNGAKYQRWDNRALNQPGAWETFWGAFLISVRKRDRKSLRAMMSSNFEWTFGGERNTPDNAFRYWGRPDVRGWSALDKVLAQGTVPYQQGDPTRANKLSRIAPPAAVGDNYYNLRAVFELGPDRRWRWVAFVKGD